MIRVKMKPVDRGVWTEVVKRAARSAMDDVEAVYEEVGQRVIEWLQSYTGEMRPPAVIGGPFRPAHPGHWADITYDLASRYEYRVVRTAQTVRLQISNDSDHAIYVERMAGFFVVSGIMDSGGPVDRAIRAVAREYGLNIRG